METASSISFPGLSLCQASTAFNCPTKTSAEWEMLTMAKFSFQQGMRPCPILDHSSCVLTLRKYFPESSLSNPGCFFTTSDFFQLQLARIHCSKKAPKASLPRILSSKCHVNGSPRALERGFYLVLKPHKLGHHCPLISKHCFLISPQQLVRC